jgi:hypothetical protein
MMRWYLLETHIAALKLSRTIPQQFHNITNKAIGDYP